MPPPSLLTPADLARIGSYVGAGQDLHDLLPAVLPLAEPRAWSATLTAQGGTVMTLDYAATPAGDDAILVAFTATGAGHTVGPVGPVRMTRAGMERPAGMSDALWREARAAAGIVVRALLLGL